MLSTIIFIAVIIIVAFILFKILKSIIKAVITVLLLVFVFGFIFGFFVIQDANNFNKTFKNEYSTYILVDEEILYTGFEAKGFDFDTYEEKSLTELQQIRADEEYLGKIIFVSTDALDFSLPEMADIELSDLLDSEDESVRSLAFKYALFTTITDEGPLFLLHHLRDGTIKIEPNSLIVRTVTFTPKPLFAKAKAKISAGKATLSGINPFTKNNVTVIGDEELAQE
jgi:energy-coupling factor transporter transmembrane protein EcfT